MTTTAPKVWMRWPTMEQAIASAARLAARYGRGTFAIGSDEIGGDFAPFTVFSSSELISVIG